MGKSEPRSETHEDFIERALLKLAAVPTAWHGAGFRCEAASSGRPVSALRLISHHVPARLDGELPPAEDSARVVRLTQPLSVLPFGDGFVQKWPHGVWTQQIPQSRTFSAAERRTWVCHGSCWSIASGLRQRWLCRNWSCGVIRRSFTLKSDSNLVLKSVPAPPEIRARSC